VIAMTEPAVEEVDFTATLPSKRMGAAVYFRDDADRVLLVEPTYRREWLLPGGAVEAGESPFEAAAREVEEELGLTVRPGRLLLVDWFPPQPDRTEGVGFVYDGGVLDPSQTARIEVPPDELRGWAWCTAEDAARRGSSLLVRELTAARGAAADNTTYYLEFGRFVA
jgi:8-oxo-dGTP pyrophosphatase MutT (NUDIX family)